MGLVNALGHMEGVLPVEFLGIGEGFVQFSKELGESDLAAFPYDDRPGDGKRSMLRGERSNEKRVMRCA